MIWPFRKANGHDSEVELYEAEHKKAVARVQGQAEELSESVADILNGLAREMPRRNDKLTNE